MSIKIFPIGVFHTDEENIPRHWSISNVEGEIVFDEAYEPGLKDVTTSQQIVVLFHFHKSKPFEKKYLIQTPPHRNNEMGVFSICSPFRPNPIGLSVLEVLGVSRNVIRVIHADMIDGTPILDIKPHIHDKTDCPSYRPDPE